MGGRSRWAATLSFAGLAMMLVALLDPLEGFPLVLVGGALSTISARLIMSRWFRLLAWGLGLSLLGCAVMILLSARGGIGGSTGVSAVWGLTLVPYPVGALLLLLGTLLLIRQILTADRDARGAQGTS
jgi:hypothetical protein